MNAMIAFGFYYIYMFDVRGGHVRGRDKETVRCTSLSSSEKVITVVSFDIFHLCGMVSKDTRALDRQSENELCRTGILSIPITNFVCIGTTK
jgi:hypothetical protein